MIMPINDKKEKKDWSFESKAACVQSNIHLYVALGFQCWYAQAADERIIGNLASARDLIDRAIASFQNNEHKKKQPKLKIKKNTGATNAGLPL